LLLKAAEEIHAAGRLAEAIPLQLAREPRGGKPAHRGRRARTDRALTRVI